MRSRSGPCWPHTAASSERGWLAGASQISIEVVRAELSPPPVGSGSRPTPGAPTAAQDRGTGAPGTAPPASPPTTSSTRLASLTPAAASPASPATRIRANPLGAGGGLGAALAEVAGLPTPEPGPPSRARPPRLLYPARYRDVDDSLVFVARLTIDRDGLVVGAHLVHGLGGRRDDQAAGAVWRFRYSPALDDDGLAIAATIDQPFAVE